MARAEQSLGAVIRQVRLAFHRLRVVGNYLHGGAGVTTAMRGVMESLAEGGPKTVPQMARDRPVSRQHIQTIVDALRRAELATMRDNPAHKRSALIELTVLGHEAFKKMRAREAAILKEVAADIPENDLAITTQTLATITRRLAATFPTLTNKDEGGMSDDGPD